MFRAVLIATLTVAYISCCEAASEAASWDHSKLNATSSRSHVSLDSAHDAIDEKLKGTNNTTKRLQDLKIIFTIDPNFRG